MRLSDHLVNPHPPQLTTWFMDAPFWGKLEPIPFPSGLQSFTGAPDEL